MFSFESHQIYVAQYEVLCVPKALPFGAVSRFVLSSQNFVLLRLYTAQGTGGSNRKEIRLGGNVGNCMTRLRV